MIAHAAIERARVVTIARSWLATPFHHAARLKDVGVDCAQMLVATYLEARIIEHAPEIGFYSPDWFLHEQSERFEHFVKAACVPISALALAAGDVVLFRYGRSISHGAIVTEWPHDERADMRRVVHAWRGRGVVEEECGPLTPLAARLATCWSFARWHTAHAEGV